ncbi:MAG TPA: hypothetical protein VGB71_17185, partial [Flavisolibacter sp.]
LEDRKTTVLTLKRNPEGGLTGNLTKTPGYIQSFAIRKLIAESGQEVFIRSLQKDVPPGYSYSDITIDSLQNLEGLVSIRSNINWRSDGKHVIYLNPMFGEGVMSSPFTSTDRLYPVEMPYILDETYILNLEIPPGYILQELPKQLLAKLDAEGKSFFEYRIEVLGQSISLRSRIKLARTYFEPEEYESLRQFFSLVVSKHLERIVLKKIE